MQFKNIAPLSIFILILIKNQSLRLEWWSSNNRVLGQGAVFLFITAFK